MNENNISKFVTSITKEPSVLILGQNYLNSTTVSDFYVNINSELNLPKSERIHFSQLFDRCNEVNKVETLFEKISVASQNYSNVPQLKSILNMRWNFVYTSAVDGIVRQNCSANPITSPTGTFKKEYGQKNPLHMAELFGNVQDDSAACSVPKESKEIRRTKLDRLTYIGKIIGDYYGVLVIDGWSKNDWLKIDKFIEVILNRECEGTYFFGISEDELIDSVPDDYKDDIKECIKYGYITIENESLINVLKKSDFFDDEEVDDTDVMNDYHISFASSKKNSPPNSLRLSKKKLIGLDRNITLIHDDLTGWGSFSEDELKESFVQFLIQERDPNWILCGNIDLFAIKRDIDDKLLEMVKKQLSASTYKRLPILLSGVSNSGKTVSLIRLALRINKELPKNPAVVFYVSDTPSSDEWKEQLQEVIKYSILHRSIGSSQINRVVLICDNIDEDITKIQAFFKEDNVLVVGSSYMHTSISGEVDDLEIPHKLSDGEKKRLKEILARFDKDGCDPDSIIKVNENSIFEVLSRYARFKHDRMWNSVRTHIGNKLGKESAYTEKDTGNMLFELFTDTENYILSHGIGSSVERELEGSGEINKKEWYTKNVRELNLLLATAGQFGKALPFDLVLKIIKKEMGSDSSPVNSKFFSELLRLDSMSENKSDESTGKLFVSFRSPTEAFKYLELNSENDDNKRRKTEINQLFKIIDNCDWTEDYSVENESVVKLVRCFGSNTLGRPFEDNDPDTKEYADYWFDISDKLFESAICDGEALVTYCHFLREAIRHHHTNHIELFDAYDALTEYYENKKVSALVNYKHKIRICGEICSNLNSIMVKYNEICKNDYPDDEDREFIKEFDNTFKAYSTKASGSFDAVFNAFEYYYQQMMKNVNADKNASFESNSRLDIWLNAAENYQNHGLSSNSEQKKHHEIMLKSLENIGQMLNCSTKNDISKLLGNVAKVFKYFKKDDISYKYAVELEHSGNDSKIYLDVMTPFFENFEEPKIDHIANKDKQILEQRAVMNRNKVCVYLNEYADKLFDDDALNKCKDKVAAAARSAVKYFEKDDKAAYKKAFKCKSARCLYIYLKCKWFYMTEGNFLLQPKQTPALTREQWDEIYDICDKYLKCADEENSEYTQPAALLLYAFYNWRFKKSVDFTKDIKEKLDKCANALGSEATFVRLGVSNEKGELCKFKVKIEGDQGKWYAFIDKNYPRCDNNTLADNRKWIYVSDETLQKICNSRVFRRMLEDKTPPVNIWFNGKNPQISICESKGDDN